MPDLLGGCVCGEVRYVAKGLPARITICHCKWCQRRTGTAFGTECVFMIGAVRIHGKSLRSYRHYSDLSGRWIEQDFCSVCGSNIGLRLEACPEIRSLAIGSFDDKSWIANPDVEVRHVFARSQLGLSLIPNDVERYEMHFRN